MLRPEKVLPISYPAVRKVEPTFIIIRPIDPFLSE